MLRDFFTARIKDEKGYEQPKIVLSVNDVKNAIRYFKSLSDILSDDFEARLIFHKKDHISPFYVINKKTVSDEDDSKGSDNNIFELLKKVVDKDFIGKCDKVEKIINDAVLKNDCDSTASMENDDFSINKFSDVMSAIATAGIDFIRKAAQTESDIASDFKKTNLDKDNAEGKPQDDSSEKKEKPIEESKGKSESSAAEILHNICEEKKKAADKMTDGMKEDSVEKLYRLFDHSLKNQDFDFEKGMNGHSDYIILDNIFDRYNIEFPDSVIRKACERIVDDYDFYSFNFHEKDDDENSRYDYDIIFNFTK